MTGYLVDYKDIKYRLPVLTGWDISHGIGTPCDAFEIGFLYDSSMLDMLKDAVRFTAEYDGKTVFRGIVDEFHISAGDGGMTATVSGRGMAAVLLDNEAEAAEYYGASLEFILQRHVYPYGITDVETGGVSKVSLFTVDSGSSQWRVLEDFVWFCSGIRPRFSRTGTLILCEKQGEYRRIGEGTAILSQTYSDRRYDVISSVTVVNKSLGIKSQVDNTEFIARGGNARRVINVPRLTYYNAMRYTGEYQIARSVEGSRVCEITLASLFAAFPGDIIELAGSPVGVTGKFTVTESRCWADADGAGTRLTLESC